MIGENVGGETVCHDLTAEHLGNLIGKPRHDPEIMRNK
jgi:hypothetical protein